MSDHGIPNVYGAANTTNEELAPQPQHRADTLAAYMESVRTRTFGYADGDRVLVSEIDRLDAALAHAGAETERLRAALAHWRGGATCGHEGWHYFEEGLPKCRCGKLVALAGGQALSEGKASQGEADKEPT